MVRELLAAADVAGHPQAPPRVVVEQQQDAGGAVKAAGEPAAHACRADQREQHHVGGDGGLLAGTALEPRVDARGHARLVQYVEHLVEVVEVGHRRTA
jgi:hypothetical protein